MKIIVISHPEFLPGEARLITSLFEAGLTRFHLRKPQATEQDTESLLTQLPSEYHPYIAVHNHHALALRYSLGGIHLNTAHPHPPAGYRGTLSASCHSLQEAARRKEEVDYLFLSPIFNSISKVGYRSAYSEAALAKAAAQHLIDEKIIALGGITPDKLPYLSSLGFGGAALLGAVWQNPLPEAVEASFRAFL